MVAVKSGNEKRQLVGYTPIERTRHRGNFVRVKVLLHDEHKKRYYAGCNTWVIEAEQGFDFGSIEKGALTKDQEKGSRVDVIVIAENRHALFD